MQRFGGQARILECEANVWTLQDFTSATAVKMKGSSQIFKNGKMEDVKKRFSRRTKLKEIRCQHSKINL